MVGVVCARRAWSAFLSASLEPCHNLPTQASVLMSPVVGPCLPQIVVPRVVAIPGPSWPCSPWPPSSGIVWLVARFPRPGIAIVCPALARPSRSFLIPARHPYRAPRTRPVNPYSRETPCAHDTARLDQTTLRSSSVTCHVCSSPLEECKKKNSAPTVLACMVQTRGCWLCYVALLSIRELLSLHRPVGHKAGCR